MNILLIGKEGQLGQRLAVDLERTGSVFGFSHTDCDITNYKTVAQIVDQVQPDIIVNAAAYTHVDNAETAVELCHNVNAQGPYNLAKAAKTHGAGFIHYSTDYVFDGRTPSPYCETDAPNPLGVYGHSKRAGENKILESGALALIIRIGWLYSESDASFLGRIMTQLFERDELRVVNDQFGAPTSAPLVSELTARLICGMKNDPAPYLSLNGGLIHLACTGKATWFDFAKEIFRLAQEANLDIRAKCITPVPSDVYPVIAERPKNSVLDTAEWVRRFGFKLPSWQEELADVFESYLLKHNLMVRS